MKHASRSSRRCGGTMVSRRLTRAETGTNSPLDERTLQAIEARGTGGSVEFRQDGILLALAE
ncbi:MAG: hypothetical protein IPN71_05890 [Fibrobacteres bacterium]|nr:hypothetical protein [Fibrobacterota bacterium]